MANSKGAASVPRRLVYVVNRRTVVDQATEEAKRLRERLGADGRSSVLSQLANALTGLAAPPASAPLAISTLRGQFADNREWPSDPARPAVIVGTADMIGSRLLFSGYGIGFKSKPLHAGFLGQDVLLVHDEAHLEPAFQTLIEAIRDEQRRCREFQQFRIMALSATSRGNDQPFTLTDADLSAVILAAESHGFGRPHFPPEVAFDPEPHGRDAEAIAAEIPQRYARLQRRYGRWGLAYIESLIRAADYAASAVPSSCFAGAEEPAT